jgi:molybdate-binding protein
MDFFIFNQTLGFYCNDNKFRKEIVLGSSGFCCMTFGCARIATLFIKENNRVHLDVVVSEEYLRTVDARTVRGKHEQSY